MAYLDQMYSGQPQRTAATGDGGFYQGAPEVSYGGGGPTPYTPLMGKRVENMWMGDHAPNPATWQQYSYVADPNVNYGGPKPGLSPYFNQETGAHEGWNGATTGGGGSGLFGDFGGAKTTESWYIDPKTGQPVSANQTATPSRNAGTNVMSYAMPIAMMAGLGAGAAGGAFSGAGGMTAAEGAALSAEAGGLGVEAAAGAGLGTSGAGAGMTAAEAAALSAEAGGLSVEGAAASNAPWWQTAFDTVQKGSQYKDYFDMASKVFDFGKGIYDTRQNKDYSGNMKGIYSDLNNRQDQFRNPLMQSYQDGGKSFYDSNQWKGLESVYQNKIDRQASKNGVNANTIDREVKLNNYAMQELEKFRDGLRNSAALTKPESALTQAAEGYEAERMASTPIGGALDRMYGRPAPGSRSSADIAKQIAGFGGDAKKIYDFISGWFA